KETEQMAQTEHTFLLKEGQWRATGTYYDHKGQATAISGHASISHQEDGWINRSAMKLEAEPPVAFENVYEIEPLDAGMETTIWETEHAMLGLMMGTLVVVEDALIMSYAAEGGNYTGTETLRRIDADHYQSWGVLWQGDQKISSWSANLERIEKGP
ncbi:MAG: hypothetical protein ACAI44_26295, partial [Candidatus Sericytochromatia bacterium]